MGRRHGGKGAGRRSQAVETLTIGDGAHDRIVREALGVIHVLVSGQAREDRLPQETGDPMATVKAGPRIGNKNGRDVSQAEGVIKHPVEQQPAV